MLFYSLLDTTENLSLNLFQDHLRDQTQAYIRTLSLSLFFLSLSLSFSHNLGRTYKRSVTEVLIFFKIFFIGLRFVRQAMYVHSLKKKKRKINPWQ